MALKRSRALALTAGCGTAGSVRRCSARSTSVRAPDQVAVTVTPAAGTLNCVASDPSDAPLTGARGVAPARAAPALIGVIRIASVRPGGMCRTVLRRFPELREERVPVKAHAPRRIRAQPVDRPRVRDLHPEAVVEDRPGDRRRREQGRGQHREHQRSRERTPTRRAAMATPLSFCAECTERAGYMERAHTRIFGSSCRISKSCYPLSTPLVLPPALDARESLHCSCQWRVWSCRSVLPAPPTVGEVANINPRINLHADVRSRSPGRCCTHDNN